jgi:hypothetical protein
MFSEEATCTPPDRPIDAIEYGRGQLAALTYLTETTAREVHILRLRASFDRAGITHKLRYVLNVLNLMREVQELKGGYWFPTPLRVIPIEEQAIIVGPVPTYELRRHFPSATRAGYTRVCLESDAKTVPKQEIDGWLGLEVYDTIRWVEAKLREACGEMGPTISSGNCQFFNVETIRSEFSGVVKPVWKNNPRAALALGDGVVLCREPVTHEYFRHFVGRVVGARLVGEGTALRDMTRVQFGFAALAGKPITVMITARDDEFAFHISAGLPRSERQLMLALGVRDVSCPGKTYHVRREFVSVIEARLQRLGCEVRSLRV